LGGGVSGRGVFEARDSKEDKYILAKILIFSCKYPGDGENGIKTKFVRNIKKTLNIHQLYISTNQNLVYLYKM
jgi:hypothetical protein